MLAAFSSWRWIVAALCTVQYALLSWDRLRRVALAVALPFFCVELGVVAGALGTLGGPEQPWIHFLYPALIGSILCPMRPAVRVLALLSLTAALLGGFLLSGPAHAQSPYFPTLLSFLAFAWAISLVAGQALFSRVCLGFRRSRWLARSIAALRSLNEELEDRIVESAHDPRVLSARLEATREQERARISRELHDELGQELSALRYAVAWARNRYAGEQSGVNASLAEMDDLVGRTASAVRRIVADLRPRALDSQGLVPAIEWLAERARERGGLHTEVAARGPRPDLPGPVVLAVFRTAQEALANVVRHAQARSVLVELGIGTSEVWILVRDDGIGFARGAPPRGAREGGAGIPGMEERARGLGGALTVESAPGRGTRVHLRLPLSGPEGA